MQSGLFIGDLHVGAEQRNGLTLDPETPGQEFLLESVRDVLTKALHKQELGYEVTLFCGGDNVDKPGKEARDEATQILSSFLVHMNGRAYGVLGTPYHVGDGGVEDAQIYDNLGIPKDRVRAVWQSLDIGKTQIAWAHHGVPIASNPLDDDRSLYNFASRVQRYRLSKSDVVPDFFIGHHVHRSSGMFASANINWRGRHITTRAGTVPCFSLPDDYAFKKMTYYLPTIGAVWIDFEHKTYEAWTYEIPESVLYQW